jgi:thiamine-monophosphate kinase
VTSEDRLIERICAAPDQKGGLSRSALRLGAGDDAAVIAPGRNADWVLSSDAFLEGAHFLADSHPADSVGYKALARATSDLAAMGARPLFFLLTLALPRERAGRWLDEFLAGLRRAAHQFGMTLIGGDTTRSRLIFISVTVGGDIAPGRFVPRSGARPGDLIFVTGTLGAAQLGLLLLKNLSGKAIDRRLRPPFSPLRAHLYPRIQLGWGAWLARHRLASAMIDVSDGLSSDLSRLCARSGVGARIWADRIPCVQIPARRAGKTLEASALSGLDPLALALHGGEDYELLFTVSPHNLTRLRRAPRFAELSEIGQVVPGRRLTLISEEGAVRPLVPSGWDPFRRK